MDKRITSASTVNLEDITQNYCSWLPPSVADLMYKDIMEKQIPPEELAGLFGLPKEQCAALLDGKSLKLNQPIYADPAVHEFELHAG
jgi:hypothetical protein